MNSWPEPQEEAWKLRFGGEIPHPVPDLGSFLNHRSVRKFSSRPVDESTISCLMGAAQSAATSSNLQLWSVISVQDPERRDKIATLCANQDQIRQAAWFFAFLADHHRLRTAAAKVGEACEGLAYTEFLIMAIVDAALAAERFVCAAESLGLGICYIGALRDHADGVKGLLALPEGTFGVFGLCVGWPEEPIKANIRPRLDQSAVWFREQYESDPDLSTSEERMRAFYESEHMRGDFTWSARSGRRVDLHHMTGREALKQWLANQGMGIE